MGKGRKTALLNIRVSRTTTPLGIVVVLLPSTSFPWSGEHGRMFELQANSRHRYRSVSWHTVSDRGRIYSSSIDGSPKYHPSNLPPLPSIPAINFCLPGPQHVDRISEVALRVVCHWDTVRCSWRELLRLRCSEFVVGSCPYWKIIHCKASRSVGGQVCATICESYQVDEWVIIYGNSRTPIILCKV